MTGITIKPGTYGEAQDVIADTIKKQWDDWGEDGAKALVVYRPELDHATKALYLLLQRDGEI